MIIFVKNFVFCSRTFLSRYSDGPEHGTATSIGMDSGPQTCDPSRYSALRGDCFTANRFVPGQQNMLQPIPDKLRIQRAGIFPACDTCAPPRLALRIPPSPPVELVAHVPVQHDGVAYLQLGSVVVRGHAGVSQEREQARRGNSSVALNLRPSCSFLSSASPYEAAILALSTGIRRSLQTLCPCGVHGKQPEVTGSFPYGGLAQYVHPASA